jgi:eukaryotic-like serine/threonine-protein kinase
MQDVTGTDSALGEVAAGRLLGARYRLLRRIASGGMATVHLARDELLERDVAVKVLHPHLADDPSVLARFRTEARHAAALVHPHIVHVYDQGDEALPFIVMEHIDGPSLREVLQRHGRLTPAEALSVIEPVCLALERAHAAGVVHRDIKPENVLVDLDGRTKVADFGIARALSETNHTQTGALIGSVHYLAPELVEGREASFATDQYAVGVLLFELLTGRRALTAETPMAVALRHGREPIPPPSSVIDDLAPEIDAVVETATAMDPDERFADLRSLVAALHAAVPEGPAPVVVERPGEGLGDRTLVIPPGPAEGADDLATFPPSGTAPHRAEPREQREEPARRRGTGIRILVTVLATLLVLATLAGGAYATWSYVIAPVQQVPALAEADAEAARTTLAGLGLELVIAAEEPSREVAEGAVLSQDPAPGAELRRGGTVAVVLSTGPAVVEVPETIGRPLAEVQALLAAAPLHLRVDRVDESYHDTAPAGTVIGMAPSAGTQVRQDSGVILNVSLGVEQVEVPDLSGMTREQAEAALAEARLGIDVSEDWSDDVPERGRVISQDVDAGAEVDVGSTVEVLVSLGPLTVTVPDVEGQGIEAGAQAVRDAGLEVRIIEEPRPYLGPFPRGEVGRVELQDEEPGSRLRRGSRVTLYTYVERGAPADSDDD